MSSLTLAFAQTPSVPAGVNYNPEWNGFLGRLPTDEELKK